MWRATLKGLLAHKVRLGLTALAIVLGVGFVSGTYILTDTINKAFDNLFSTITRGVAVQVSGIPKFKASFGGEAAGQPERVPSSLIPRIRAIPGVRAVQGELTGYAQLVAADGTAVTTGGAPTLGVAAQRDQELSGVTTRAGREPVRAGEISIDARTAEQHGFHVGRTVTVLVQGPPLRARVVGIFGFGNADNLGGATVVAFDPATAQRVLHGAGRWDAIDVAAQRGVSPADLRDRIQRILPKGYQAKTGAQAAQENSDELKKSLSFFNIALLVFAGVALFVGAFIIFNTFSILVAQRTRELALLRALGASSKQVRRSVIAEAAVTGVVASAAGLAFGFVIAVGLQGLLRAFGIVLPSTTNQLLPRTIIASFAVGTITTVVSSVMPAIRASRVPPVAAMRETPPAEYTRSRPRTAAGAAVTVVGVAALMIGLFGGHGAALVGLGAAIVFLGVAVLSPVIARPLASVLGAPLSRLGISGKLGRENAMRNPRRTASTAAALMIGLGLVSFVSIFAASVKASANAALRETLKADYAVIPSSLAGGSVGFSLDVASRLRSTGTFASVVEFRQGIFGVKGGAQQVVATDPRALPDVENVTMLSGTVEGLGDDGILVYRNTAESNGWRMGQIVPVQFARTGTRRLRVEGIFSDNRGLGNYVLSLAAFDRNFTEQLDAEVLLKNAPGVTSREAARTVAEVAKAFPNVKIENQEQLRQTTANQINQLLGLITALLGLAIIIAVVGIINTLVLSVFERTHEIGLLRAVGMARRQVRAMIRWESVIIAVFGATLGIAVGAFFGWAMVRALRSQGITELAFPAGQLLVYILLAGMFGVVAGLWPARRAARLDVLAAITHE